MPVTMVCEKSVQWLLKEVLSQKNTKKTLSLYLLFQMEYIDVGTPLSNKYYLGQPEGEMYGMKHSLNRFYPENSVHLRAESGIPGLYLTGNTFCILNFVSFLDLLLFQAWENFDIT